MAAPGSSAAAAPEPFRVLSASATPRRRAASVGRTSVTAPPSRPAAGTPPTSGCAPCRPRSTAASSCSTGPPRTSRASATRCAPPVHVARGRAAGSAQPRSRRPQESERGPGGLSPPGAPRATAAAPCAPQDYVYAAKGGKVESCYTPDRIVVAPPVSVVDSIDARGRPPCRPAPPPLACRAGSAQAAFAAGGPRAGERAGRLRP